jgi:glycosyltransferase involved in cell wall biosynthesis
VLSVASVSYELIFVDDACPEGSGGAIQELSARDSRVRGLHLARNVGQHRAAWLGLSTARGEWSIIMDADLQDPPEAIPALLVAAPSSVDAVLAARRGRYEGPVRLLTSRLFKILRERLTGVPRDAGMFMALRRPLVQAILRHDVSRPFLTAMVGLSGRRFITVPVDRARRPQGRSAYSSVERLATAARELAFVLKHRARLKRRGTE